MDGKARKAPKGAVAKPVTPQQVKKTPVAGKAPPPTATKKGAAVTAAAALALGKAKGKGTKKERDFSGASIYNLLCLGGVCSVGLAANKKNPELKKYQFAAAVGEIYMEPVDEIIRSIEALIDDGPVGVGRAETKGHRVGRKEIDYAIERALGKRLVGSTDVEEHRPKHRKGDEDEDEDE